MTKELLMKKWNGISVNDMDDRQMTAFKEDCFEMYEQQGFLDKFNSPYDVEGEHNGQEFKVLRRATREEVDAEAMPIWLVEFENGDTAYCYPEEICRVDGDAEKTTWNVRRMSCRREVDCEDVATGLPTYGAALGCLNRIAKTSKTVVTHTSKSGHVVVLTQNNEATLYWIYKKTTTNKQK